MENLATQCCGNQEGVYGRIVYQPPQQPSTGQPQPQQVGGEEEEEEAAEGLEDEEKEMRCRGRVRPHADDKGPTSEKQVFNCGECRPHDSDWEEPLVKRIRHLR
jgi:hypothetical protein